jgi:predicted ribosome quality control (RQC) complex YloA/Tae2 family protein
MEAKEEWVREQLLAKEKGGITRAISRTININGLYASEICLRAGVDPDKKAADITEEEVEQLLQAIEEVRAIAADEKINPVKYYTEKGEIEDIVPFPLESYKEYKKEETETFSKPLDEYYSTRETDKESEKELSVEAKKIQQIETIKKKQEDHLKQLQHTAEKDKEIGDLIYLHLNELEELLTTITKARRNKVEWSEIKEKMALAEDKGMKGARLLKDIRENNKAVLVEIEGNTIHLDFLDSATDNATRYYERAKKAEGKITGAQKKIAELAERIKKLEQGLIELEQKETVMIEKRDREWFEKFHWFQSSDGFLVLAGKDQRSNTMLVKRYLEKGDLFLHAELHGAAAVVIKTEGKKAPQQTIDEAAIFSVCYSKAWKDGLSHEDTYWVNHDQVSFSAPSGEYLAKGSFIITGNKNQLKNIPLELAVCPVIEEKWAYVLCGPKTALKASEKAMKSKIITVIPGEVTKSQVAKKIVAKFLDGLSEADKEKIEATNLNELISHLPGDCYIKEEY